VITQSSSDPTIVATDLPSGAGTRSSMFEQPAGVGRSRERIHRFASRMHQAIDNLEQRLSSRSSGATSTFRMDRARQYGDKVREQFHARPLQSAGVALAAGALLDKLFTRSPKVRVVSVHVPAQAPWDPTRSVERRARRWTSSADEHLQNVGRASREAAGKVGTTASLGIAGTRATASRLTGSANTLPLQMRLATQRLLARSQEYGSLARSGVQAHPLVGLGAVFGASALLTTLFLRRREPAPGVAYAAVDEKGNGVAWQRDRTDVPTGARNLISSRPVASAAVTLGLGALIGALLMRR